MAIIYNSIPSSSVTVTGSQIVAPASSGTGIPTGRTLVQKSMAQTCVANTHYTIHTVTVGKKLYVTSLVVTAANAGEYQFRVGDNTSGDSWTSTTVYTNSLVIAANAGGIAITFPTPLEISTKLNFSSPSGVNASIAFVGWEE